MDGLYASLLGPAWASLSASVRSLHAGGVRARGALRVRRGQSLGARLLGALLGLPEAGLCVPLTLATDRLPGAREGWSRSFAGRGLRSVQRARAGLLVEALGLVQCVFRLRAAQGALVFDQVGARFGLGAASVAIPTFFAPAVQGVARPTDEGVWVDVAIGAPVVGLLVAYDGLVTLEPAQEAP